MRQEKEGERERETISTKVSSSAFGGGGAEEEDSPSEIISPSWNKLIWEGWGQSHTVLWEKEASIVWGVHVWEGRCKRNAEPQLGAGGEAEMRPDPAWSQFNREHPVLFTSSQLCLVVSLAWDSFPTTLFWEHAQDSERRH